MAMNEFSFAPLTIDNYRHAADFLKGERVTEYGITPTCLYAPFDGVEVADLGDGLLCRYQEDGVVYYTVVCDSNPDLAKKTYERLLSAGELHLKYLSEERLALLRQWFSHRIVSVETEEGQSDYLYLREDFLNLAGRNARHKREHVQSFLKTYSFSYEEITAAHGDTILSVTDAWCSRRDCRDCEYSCERDLIANLFKRWDDFPCRGGLVSVEGNPMGFFIGEVLGDTVIGYHQKTATTDIVGLSQMVYLESIRNTFPDVSYVNLGPDLGIEGLRRLKRQFKPFTLLHKYTVTLR